MKPAMNILAVAIMVAGTPALADTFVVASPGVTLTQAAQAKFNRDTRPGDRQVTPDAGNSAISPHLYRAAGLTPEEADGWTLEQIFVAKINRESGDDQEQVWMPDSPASVSRGFGGNTEYLGLARSVGISAEDAAGMTPAEIAAAKLNYEH